MKNKNKQTKKKNLPKLMKKMRIATPFADAGRIAGNTIGGMFGNASLGKGVGRWLGSGIGSIFGSGDYQIAGAAPAYNVIANGSQIPKFDSTRQTNIVCHREYLGDITGTSAFNVGQYPLNPGLPTTFPWLATVAQNYQEYKFHGVVFEFRSLVTDFVTGGAPGVVIMSTNYNSGDVAYTTKQQMENAEFAVSTKPTTNLMHGIECADKQTIMPQRYVRTGPVPAGQDIKTYDTGLFQFATQGNPIQNLGELWVSYCVEFFKPILSDDIGGNTLSSRIYRTNVSAASPLGLIQLTNLGDLGLTATANTISWLAYPAVDYQVSFAWVGAIATAFTVPTFSLTGLIAPNILNNGFSSFVTGPGNGIITIPAVTTGFVTCISANPSVVTITLGAGGAFAATTAVDIVVTQVSNAMIG